MQWTLFYNSLELQSQAVELAHRFNFELIGIFRPTDRVSLNLTSEGLFLYIPGMKPWTIDFLSTARQHRRQFGGQETLVRACGIKKNKEPLTIVDATAGWGKDAFVLACAGTRVILIERHPLLAALLEDALKRFYAHPTLSKNVHISLHHDDAEYFLQRRLLTVLQELPDVIYWDPMHPERHKSAQVKKEMALLQQWAQPELHPESLIRLSLPYVKDRVVLKWPRKAPLLDCLKPSFVYEEKTVRFEVFKKMNTAIALEV